jgi:hypothetical protein
MSILPSCPDLGSFAIRHKTSFLEADESKIQVRMPSFQKKQLESLTLLLKKKADLRWGIALDGPSRPVFYREQGLFLMERTIGYMDDSNHGCARAIDLHSSTVKSLSSVSHLYYMPTSERFLSFDYEIGCTSGCFRQSSEFTCNGIIQLHPSAVFTLLDVRELRKRLLRTKTKNDLGAPLYVRDAYR